MADQEAFPKLIEDVPRVIAHNAWARFDCRVNGLACFHGVIL